MKRVLIAALLLLPACGAAGGAEADRTVQVEMRDNVFAPAALEVARGETVRFVFTNRGSVAHDAVIGDEEAQREHAEEMAGGDMHHDGGDALTLEPGDSGDLTYTFDEAGAVEIGCHQPGHYEAGMKVDITVA